MTYLALWAAVVVSSSSSPVSITTSCDSCCMCEPVMFFYMKLLTPPWHPPQLVLRTAPWQYLWQPRMHCTVTALWLVKGPNTREPSCFEFIGVAAVDEERSLNFCCCSKIKYGSLK